MNTSTFYHGHLRGLVFSLLTFLVLGLLLSGPVAAQENCTQLLTTQCEVCHYMTRVCQKVDRERQKKSWFGGSEGKWKRTIKNMVKHGAKLTKAEEKVLVQCLSKPGSEVLGLCKLK